MRIGTKLKNSICSFSFYILTPKSIFQIWPQENSLIPYLMPNPYLTSCIKLSIEYRIFRIGKNQSQYYLFPPFLIFPLQEISSNNVWLFGMVHLSTRYTKMFEVQKFQSLVLYDEWIVKEVHFWILNCRKWQKFCQFRFFL